LVFYIAHDAIDTSWIDLPQKWSDRSLDRFTFSIRPIWHDRADVQSLEELADSFFAFKSIKPSALLQNNQIVQALLSKQITLFPGARDGRNMLATDRSSLYNIFACTSRHRSRSCLDLIEKEYSVS